MRQFVGTKPEEQRALHHQWGRNAEEKHGLRRLSGIAGFWCSRFRTTMSWGISWVKRFVLCRRVELRLACYNFCPRRFNVEPSERSPAVKAGAVSSTQENSAIRRSSESADRTRRSSETHWQKWRQSIVWWKAPNHVSSSPQAHRCSATRPVGEVESIPARQVSKTTPHFPHFFPFPFTDI